MSTIVQSPNFVSSDIFNWGVLNNDKHCSLTEGVTQKTQKCLDSPITFHIHRPNFTFDFASTSSFPSEFPRLEVQWKKSSNVHTSHSRGRWTSDQKPPHKHRSLTWTKRGSETTRLMVFAAQTYFSLSCNTAQQRSKQRTLQKTGTTCSYWERGRDSH